MNNLKNIESKIWTERFRPSTFNDLILPKRIRCEITGILNATPLVNLMLSSSGSGLGKTSLAKIIVNELEADDLFINASLDRNVDIIRNDVIRFVTGRSLNGNKKVVIFDEIDNMSRNAQLSLKSLMETHSSNAVFIFTSNYLNKIENALISRCVVIDYNFTTEEQKDIKKKYYIRLKHILELLEIKYSEQVLIQVINKLSPDMRAILNQLRKFTINSEISSDVLENLNSSEINNLVISLKKGDMKEVRTFIRSIESERSIINLLVSQIDLITEESVLPFMNALTTCDNNLSHVGNSRLCLLYYLTVIMKTVNWK